MALTRVMTRFDNYPGIWCQGDWTTSTDRGSALISGRSDASTRSACTPGRSR